MFVAKEVKEQPAPLVTLLLQPYELLVLYIPGTKAP